MGCEPATNVSFVGGVAAGATGISESEGFNAGRAAACLLSTGFASAGLLSAGLDATAAVVFGAVASGCDGSLRFASAGFGLTEVDAADGSAELLPSPILRARLLKK